MNSSLSDKPVICAEIFTHEPLCCHMQIVFLPEGCQLCHHGRRVMHVNSCLIFPGIDQQHSLRIVQRQKVLLPVIGGLSADIVSEPRALQFLGKWTCAAIGSFVIKINGNHMQISI